MHASQAQRRCRKVCSSKAAYTNQKGCDEMSEIPSCNKFKIGNTFIRISLKTEF